MTIEQLYAEVSPIAAQILGIQQFDSAVNMHSTPQWDSLNHVRLLSAMEKKFSIEVGADEAFKLTSADRLVEYLHGILRGKP